MTDLSPIPLLEALVAIDTQNPPGREVEAVARLADELKRIGLSVTTQEFRPGRANVVAEFVNGDGPTFCFNSHVDVVPAGTGWQSDPHRLTRRDGRLYGRGACDAKGPIAAMTSAVESLVAQRERWSGRLMAVFVADEEVASDGARHYVAGGPEIDWAVIGEPTSNSVVTAHKGSLRPLVRVHGETAHSGTPHLGVNAIFRAARLLGLAEDHAATLAARTHPLCGQASLTVTRVQGGLADNVVPDATDFLLDRRMVPGEAEADARAEIAALLALAKDRFGVQAEVVEWRPTTGAAGETAADRPIVPAALAACGRHGGDGVHLHGFMGGCDLVHFRSVGADGVVIGPGSLAVAHKPDEYVPEEELMAAVLVYRDTALAMLHRDGATR